VGISNIFALLGGVSLFLFGMGLMGDSLKLVAGQRLELILYRLSSTPIKGVLLGLAVTAVIQSSSATSAMVVGFVNSGMMKLAQGIGIVLGANIGTSVTGWILCLSYVSSSDALSLLSSSTITALAAIAGILLRMLGKSTEKRHAGDVLLGFAVLMYGMNAMSSAVSPLKESEAFLRLMTMFRNPILGILIGVLITAVLQSNSASVGILQALSVTGTITFATAFPMIMGMGIGAAVPVLVSAIGANRDGKRTSLIYLFTDVFGTIVCSTVFYTINAIHPFNFMNSTVDPVGIALINSLFRIVTILLLFPFLRQLEALTGRLVPEKSTEKYNELTSGIERLEERFVAHPALAIEQCRLTINNMALRAQENLTASLELMNGYSQSGFQHVSEIEDAVDQYEDHIGTYLVKFTGRELSDEQNEEVSKFLHTIGDFERISDHSMNLAEVAREIYEKDIVFSSAARHELDVLRSAVSEIVSLAVSAFVENDLETALRVEPLEETIDGLCDEMKLHHIIRLQDGTCTLSVGFVFNDLLTNYERIADHCSNIAVAMIELESDSFDTHEYLRSLREMKTKKFIQYAEEYGKKFAL
jgi:phosphate:Na+ symporter